MKKKKKLKSKIENRSSEVIELVINERLQLVPDKIKKIFPSFLRGEVGYALIENDRYCIVFVGGKSDISKLSEGIITDLIGWLIKDDSSDFTAIKFEKGSRDIFIKSCTMYDQVAFDLGPDCTVILQDHKQICTSGGKKKEFHIDLAYILTYGTEITQDNFSSEFDDLVAYSVKVWREGKDGV
jgi:hypothetical protein